MHWMAIWWHFVFTNDIYNYCLNCLFTFIHSCRYGQKYRMELQWSMEGNLKIHMLNGWRCVDVHLNSWKYGTFTFCGIHLSARNETWIIMMTCIGQPLMCSNRKTKSTHFEHPPLPFSRFSPWNSILPQIHLCFVNAKHSPHTNRRHVVLLQTTNKKPCFKEVNFRFDSNRKLN